MQDTEHALESRAHRQVVCPAGTGLHFSPAPQALAFSLFSPQLTPCLLVHYTMINQAVSAQGFYSVTLESLSSAASSPTPRKN